MPEAVVGPILALTARLRADGVRVGTGEAETALRALGVVDVSSRASVRLALRTVLCSRREDFAVFDAAFEAVFGTEDAARAGVDLGPGATLALPRVASPDPPARPQLEAVAEPVVVPAAYSAMELLGDKDFAQYSDAERALARTVLRALAARGPTRLGRRTKPVRRGGDRVDLQGTLRAAVRHGGEPLERRGRSPVPRPRPLVLLLDVSGSMAPYARVLLQYAQAAVSARRRVEAFAFGTRLTRVTLELRGRDPDVALDRAARAVVDWSGGTRIGAAIGTLNREHGRRLGRGAVVVVLSDGWDRGEPELLSAELARLRRSSHRVIWLNPLKATPGFAPLARGMAAALPHTDHFLAGHSLRSLADLADLLEAA